VATACANCRIAAHVPVSCLGKCHVRSLLVIASLCAYKLASNMGTITFGLSMMTVWISLEVADFERPLRLPRSLLLTSNSLKSCILPFCCLPLVEAELFPTIYAVLSLEWSVTLTHTLLVDTLHDRYVTP